VPLQKVLHVDAGDLQVRRKVSAGEEEREHGARGQLVVVRCPCHARERRVCPRLCEMALVRESRSARVQRADVEAHQVQRPRRGPVAAGPPGPHILVRVDKTGDAVPSCLAHQRQEIVEIRLVVLAGSPVFHRLPRHKETDERETPRAQTCEVLVRVSERKGPVDKRDRRGLVEALRHVRSPADRELRGPRHVHPAQQQSSPLRVAEPGALVRTKLVPLHLRGGQRCVVAAA